MKVLILGTGQAQADAIQYIREKGHTVYGCSSIAGDSAEQHCDYFQNIDITDIDAIRKYAETPYSMLTHTLVKRLLIGFCNWKSNQFMNSIKILGYCAINK